MSAESSEARQLSQLVNAIRPIALLLAFLALRGTVPGSAILWPFIFLGAYLIFAVGVFLAGRVFRIRNFRYLPETDAIVMFSFLLFLPSVTAFWFFYLFVAFSLGALSSSRASRRLGEGRPGHLLATAAAWLCAVSAIAVVARAAWLQSFASPNRLWWIGLGAGTYLSGLCAAWLGLREHARIHEDSFVASLVSMLRVEKGLAESVRLVLSELCREFDCERALLVICDEEIDRMFVWRADQDRRHVIAPETLPLARAGAYVAEDLSQNVCWNSFEGAGKGFAWRYDTSIRARKLQSPPATASQELQARAVMAVTTSASGHPTGRFLLVNPRRPFAPPDLRWLERIVRHLNAPLENVFLLRSFRARAVEAERSRISRDLHDGILQTLLSLNIQLGVLRRKLPPDVDHIAEDFASVEKTLREQGDELRQMVKDLRPLRVESADLREMMYSFAERYHNESGLAVDLFLAENDLRAPDRICREVFQIYRESLNNIKKHARASHVVVKLWQDDTKIFLVVDDNGQGFSFSGRFGSEELDRLRLGPISIKERTRSVGGVLTVESNPGHGARLTIEIPLN
jgi:signal transduction histidine kinase